MPTYQQPSSKTDKEDVYAQGRAQVEAERKKLGITAEDIERRQQESLSRPF
jgi:hypothetical protein